MARKRFGISKRVISWAGVAIVASAVGIFGMPWISKIVPQLGAWIGIIPIFLGILLGKKIPLLSAGLIVSGVMGLASSVLTGVVAPALRV